MTANAAEPDPWEAHAAWWQDHFTEGADPEYEEQILPMAARLLPGFERVLEIGCGEGQVSRRISCADGDDAPVVVGIDRSFPQVAEAARRGGGPHYAQATVAPLPFGPATFDAVVACLVLEHVDDEVAAIEEAARVLRPGGCFVLFINHPLLQTPESGWIDDHVLEPPEQYWRVGPYLDEVAFHDIVSPGIEIRFVHRPLHRYVNAMADAGLLIEHMDEPAPPPGFVARAPEYGEAARIPRLLVLVASKHDH
jgi:SAM-dependent methyltransferase